MANEVVGQAGLQAIRDFIKPYVIGMNDISNSSSIFTNYWADDFSACFFGHSSLRYTWWIDSGTITNALKWNFWQVTEDDTNLPAIILSKTNPNTYEGMRISSDYNAYYYTVKVSSNHCDVWVRGTILPVDNASTVHDGSIPVADVCLPLLGLIEFSYEDLTRLFTAFMGQNSIIFTKTETSQGFSGTDMNKWFFTIPLDSVSDNALFGTVEMNLCGGFLDSTASPWDLISYWQGESFFYNRHQKWQMSYNFLTNEKTFVMVNTQDVAIQTLSAAQYASITKDPNTLYFIPEE